MATIQNIALTLRGETISNLKVAIGSTVNWTLTLLDPNTFEPIDLTGGNCVMALSAIDGVTGLPILPAVFAHQGTTQGDPTLGISLVEWVDGDTVPAPDAPLAAGRYGVEVWVEDGDGNRTQVLAFVYIDLTPAAYLPDDPVTPLPSQNPLAQGPAGPTGPPGTIALDADIQDVSLTADSAGPDVGRYAGAQHAHLLPDTDVTPGTYSPPGSITVDQQGRITDIEIGTENLPSLSGDNKAVLVEVEPGGTLIFRRLTEDDILPGFSISAFTASQSMTKEIGDTIVNPAFTASYSSLPTSVSLNDGTGAVALNTPFASFAYGTSPLAPTTYSKSVANQTVGFTLDALLSGAEDTATVTATWRARVYFGIATPATLNAAFITGLPSSRITQATFTASYAIGAGSNTKKAYVAFPASFGTPASFKDHATGFAVPMSLVATVTVTNAFSVATSYSLWGSDNLLNAAFTLDIA